MEETNQSEIWQLFGVTEEEFNQIQKQVDHAEIDAEDDVSLFKLCFPNSKLDALKAYLAYMTMDDEE